MLHDSAMLGPSHPLISLILSAVLEAQKRIFTPNFFHGSEFANRAMKTIRVPDPTIR